MTKYAFQDSAGKRMRHGRFAWKSRPGNRAARWRSVCVIDAMIFGVIALAFFIGGYPVVGIIFTAFVCMAVVSYHRGWPMEDGYSPIMQRCIEREAKREAERESKGYCDNGR